MCIYIYVYTGPTRGLSGFCIRGDYLWPLHPCVSSRGTRVCKDVCVWLCARVAKSFASVLFSRLVARTVHGALRDAGAHVGGNSARHDS